MTKVTHTHTCIHASNKYVCMYAVKAQIESKANKITKQMQMEIKTRKCKQLHNSLLLQPSHSIFVCKYVYVCMHVHQCYRHTSVETSSKIISSLTRTPTHKFLLLLLFRFVGMVHTNIHKRIGEQRLRGTKGNIN